MGGPAFESCNPIYLDTLFSTNVGGGGKGMTGPGVGAGVGVGAGAGFGS